MGRGRLLWGLGLIGLGICIGISGFGHLQVSLDGWWTLLLIVPCAAGLLRRRSPGWNAAGLAIGVVLLAVCRGWLDLRVIWRFVVPALLLGTGLVVLLGGWLRPADSGADRLWMRRESGTPEYCAAFSGKTVDFAGYPFRGTGLTAFGGSLKCDLTGARFDRDAVLEVDAVCGVVEIRIPAHIRVVIRGRDCVGVIREKKPHSGKEHAVTVYIDGMCFLGGVTIL